MDNEPGRLLVTAPGRYAGAICCVIIAYACAAWLSRHFESAAASMFLVAIALSAWLGGLGPGLSAVALSLLAFDYSFVSPLHSLYVNRIDLPRMLMFSFTATSIGGLGALQNRTARSLRDAHRRLAQTVAMLTTTNQALKAENAEHLRVAEQLRLARRFSPKARRSV
jgi:K+-sensing histidine kinase KdpD